MKGNNIMCFTNIDSDFVNTRKFMFINVYIYLKKVLLPLNVRLNHKIYKLQKGYLKF